MSAPRSVVVCGAGVMGAATAYFLARRGVDVTVVERSGVACAASGKSGGFLALDWCDDSPLGPLARASFALHAELAKSIPTDYGYRRMDTFMLAAREQGTLRGEHRVTPPRWVDDAGAVHPAGRRHRGPRLDRDDRPGPSRVVHRRADRGGSRARSHRRGGGDRRA